MISNLRFILLLPIWFICLICGHSPSSSGNCTYYLAKENYSVAGTGDKDGKVQAVNFSPMGSFETGRACDFNGDGHVAADDFGHLLTCAANGSDVSPPAACVDAQGRVDTDLNGDGDVDGADVAACQPCMSGMDAPAPSGCAGRPPASGTPTLHGRPIEVLAGGLTLMPVHARVYDPRNARWLQRDPLGYVDGPNLYEAFGGNPLTNTDPDGLFYRLSSSWVSAPF